MDNNFYFVNLEQQLEGDLLDLYKSVRESVYDPFRFHQQLINHGGVEAARRLLSEKGIHDGLTKLWENNSLSLSFEAFLLREEKYHSLFSEDMLTNARRKLKSLGFEETTMV